MGFGWLVLLPGYRSIPFLMERDFLFVTKVNVSTFFVAEQKREIMHYH